MLDFWYNDIIDVKSKVVIVGRALLMSFIIVFLTFCLPIFMVDENALPVRDKFARLPLKMDSPEKVLCQAHGQARPVADFLHENGTYIWTLAAHLKVEDQK